MVMSYKNRVDEL